MICLKSPDLSGFNGVNPDLSGALSTKPRQFIGVLWYFFLQKINSKSCHSCMCVHCIPTYRGSWQGVPSGSSRLLQFFILISNPNISLRAILKNVVIKTTFFIKKKYVGFWYLLFEFNNFLAQVLRPMIFSAIKSLNLYNKTDFLCVFCDFLCVSVVKSFLFVAIGYAASFVKDPTWRAIFAVKIFTKIIVSLQMKPQKIIRNYNLPHKVRT